MPGVVAVPDDDGREPEVQDAHVLVLGDKVFSCADHMPFGTLLKYADNDADIITMHHILTKLVHPDQHEDMWDAFDEVGIEAGGEAISKVMASYMERPTEPDSRSQRGSGRTKRK